MKKVRLAAACLIPVLASVLILVSFLASLVFPSGSHAQTDRYQKSTIADARYGVTERESLLKRAYKLAGGLDQRVFGQKAATAVIQAKLIQYLEGFPNRAGEPVMVNMVGLPGIGKSAIIEYLKREKFPLLEFDAQDYADPKKDFNKDLYTALSEKGFGKGEQAMMPTIAVVEELDKLGEKSSSDKSSAEVSSGLIGAINKISSEGKVAASETSGRTIPVSNVMFITTMNIAPADFETFADEVLKRKKSYYDFTIEDFVKFDEWIREGAGSRYKILSKVFRSNTVGRLGANTMILRPLVGESYRAIIREQIDRAIYQNVQGKNQSKQVTVEVHPSVIDFLEKTAVYAPSGARETVNMTNSLVEQLINFGVKVTGPGLKSTDRPRHIEIRYSHEHDGVYVRVTERVLKKGLNGLQNGNAVAFRAEYDSAARIFLPPKGISAVKPTYATKEIEDVPASEKRVLKKETLALRFPEESQQINGLAKTLNGRIFGQEEAIDILVDDFKKYLGRSGPAKKEPSSRAIAGFSGIGKSELFKQIGEILNLPVIQINMQEYSSDSAEAIYKLLGDLEAKIIEAQETNEDGRYILLIEELDKAFEVDASGKNVNRPIMAIIKDMLNDGILKIGDGLDMDVRKAFIGINLNFGSDSFGFEADPRMTSIDDVMEKWKKMKSTPATVRGLLAKMFLPDTIGRLMPQLLIMRPLDRAAYGKIISQQLVDVQKVRLFDEDKRNVGQIRLQMTSEYRNYIFRETVIPSDGARNTAKRSHMLMTTDLEYAIAHLPKRSKYASLPLVITLDYSVARQAVRYKVQVDPKVQVANADDLAVLQLEERKVALNFPPTSTRGRMSEVRLHTTAHEFGHAFTGARLGSRFEHVVVVSPSPDIGGYVKPNDKGETAIDMLADIYMTLGSRAFERIIFSPNPLDRDSVLRITSGPSQDIQMATKTLYHMLYMLGMNPEGGTLDRNFTEGPSKYAAYQEMPSELAEKLGLILRDIEDQIVRETLQEHPVEWYVEKIATLARAGSMTEAEFYRLIGRELPEPNKFSVGAINNHFRSLFAKHLVKPTAVEKRAAQDRAGRSGLTPAEQTGRAMESFGRIIRHRLGTAPKPARTCGDLFAAGI